MAGAPCPWSNPRGNVSPAQCRRSDYEANEDWRAVLCRLPPVRMRRWWRGSGGDDGRPPANSPPVAARANSHPVAALPGGPILGALAAPIYYDATQGGRAFTDPDGDTLTYSLQFLTPSRGLVIQGTYVIGTLATPSVAALKIQAHDGYGGVGEQTFWFAVVAPDPGRPFLPPVEYVYDELLLSPPLPSHFASVKKIDTDRPENHVSNAGATLGRVLFYDKRLSATNTHSCASCHRQDHGFATPDRFPTGVTNIPLQRNAMGLMNVRYNARRLLLGSDRGETLESAVTLRPIEAVHELGNSFTDVGSQARCDGLLPRSFHCGVRVTRRDARPNSEGTCAVLAVDHLVSIDVRPRGGESRSVQEHFTRLHRRAAARSRYLRMGLFPWRLP